MMSPAVVRDVRLEALAEATAAPIDHSCPPDPEDELGGPARFALVLEPIIGDDDHRDAGNRECIETFATVEHAATRAADGYVYDALRPLGVWDLEDGDVFKHEGAELRARPHYVLAAGTPTVAVRFEAGPGAHA